MPPKIKTPMERFLPKVQKSEECWTWTGSINSRGYGQFRWSAKMPCVAAHRCSYMLFVGAIPAGLEIDHTCNNRRCVNPDHLEAVTHLENIQRSYRHTPQRDRVRSASRKAATSCHRGHALEGKNLYVSPDGDRHCRTCRRERAREYLPGWRAKRRAEDGS